MRISYRKLSNQSLGRAARTLLFFILFYLYLWLVVDLRLIYHGGGMITNFPVFYRGWTFFRPFLSYPGGPVEYICAFLSQLLYIGWAGAIVVTAHAWLICLCTGYFLKTIGASVLRLLRFVPPVLILITYTQYTYHFVTTTALLASLLFVCFYIRIAQKSKPFCLVTFLVLSVILYYIAGGAYLLFALLCTIYELFFALRWRMALVYLLSAVVIPYCGGVVIVGVSIIDAFSNLLPFAGKVYSPQAHKRMAAVACIIYVLLPLSILALAFWRVLVGSKVKQEQRPKMISWCIRKPALKWFTESCLLLVLSGMAVLFFHDDTTKALFEVDYYACRRMWPQLLAAARRCQRTYIAVHVANRALYHTGRLGFDMFSFPQDRYTLFLTSEIPVPSAYWKRFDTYLDLGLINLAEYSLTQSLEIFGERPIVLKQLAVTNMVKGNIGPARIYLGALSKTFFYADWAKNCLARLQSDPSLTTDKEIQRLRQLMMDKEYGATSFEHVGMLSDLLAKNRQNQMAFEYLMACCLLTADLEKFVQNLSRLDDFDYPLIPRLYEQAILIYQAAAGKKVDLKGRRISPESRRQLQKINQTFDRYMGNKQAAFSEMAKYYGDSYFFYYTYGVSGKGK